MTNSPLKTEKRLRLSEILKWNSIISTAGGVLLLLLLHEVTIQEKYNTDKHIDQGWATPVLQYHSVQSVRS